MYHLRCALCNAHPISVLSPLYPFPVKTTSDPSCPFLFTGCISQLTDRDLCESIRKGSGLFLPFCCFSVRVEKLDTAPSQFFSPPPTLLCDVYLPLPLSSPSSSHPLTPTLVLGGGGGDWLSHNTS